MRSCHLGTHRENPYSSSPRGVVCSAINLYFLLLESS
jgi:hypothetical protein